VCYVGRGRVQADREEKESNRGAVGENEDNFRAEQRHGDATLVL
jgi:hypothetical protein